MKPVVIVGGGPAGLSTALHLRALRPRQAIVVLERGAYPRDKVCAGAIAGRALPLLTRLGVDLERDVPSVRIDRMVVQMHGATIAVKERECARVVRRIELDHALAKRALEHDIDVRTGQHVTALERDADGVRVTLRDGALDARIVIGADGIMGTTRRALGLRTHLRAQAVEVDTERTADDEPTDTARFVFDDRLRGYRWDFPTPLSGTIKMSRGAYQLCDDDSHHEPRAHLRRHLEERGLALADHAPRQLAERGFDPRAPVSSSRVLLVGEAAGIDFPTGEGIAQALFYGEIAAPYLARALDTHRHDFDDWSKSIAAHPEGRFLARRFHVGRLLFGRARPLVECVLARSPALWQLLLRRFAGRSLGRAEMLRALLGYSSVQ